MCCSPHSIRWNDRNGKRGSGRAEECTCVFLKPHTLLSHRFSDRRSILRWWVCLLLHHIFVGRRWTSVQSIKLIRAYSPSFRCSASIDTFAFYTYVCLCSGFVCCAAAAVETDWLTVHHRGNINFPSFRSRYVIYVNHVLNFEWAEIIIIIIIKNINANMPCAVSAPACLVPCLTEHRCATYLYTNLVRTIFEVSRLNFPLRWKIAVFLFYGTWCGTPFSILFSVKSTNGAHTESVRSTRTKKHFYYSVWIVNDVWSFR